jgi:hypothetical protein
MRKIFGREPAVFWALAATLVQALFLLVPWSDEVHGVVNAATLAAAGFLTAAWVSVDAALPALIGLLKAVFAVVLAFGVDFPDTTQVGILAVVTAIGAFFVRQNVEAKVGPAPSAHPMRINFADGGSVTPAEGI